MTIQNDLIYVFDIDGTLLDSNGKLTKGNRQYITKLVKENKEVILSTSRCLGRTIPLAKKLGMKKYHSGKISCLGGNLIFDFKDNSVKNIAIFENKIAKDIIDLVSKYGAFHYYTKTKSYFVNEHSNLIKRFIYKYKYDIRHINIKKIKDTNDVLKICSFNKIDDSKSNLIDAHFCINVDEYEFIPKKVSKLEGLKISGINLSKVIYFGDGMNDIEAFKNVKYSVAMKNANEDVKKSAKYVTALDNNNDGVSDFLKNIFNKWLFIF